MLVAGIGVFVSIAIALLQARSSIPTLLNTVIVVVLLSAIGVWAGLNTTQHIVFVFGVVVWEQLQYTLAEFEWYGIQGEMLTIQQGKRLMGAIGGIEELAKIATYLAVPFLLTRVAVHHLLLLSIALYVVQLFVMQGIFRHQKSVLQTSTAETETDPPQRFSQLIRKPYVQGIFAFMAVLIMFEMTINVGFFSSIQLRYQTEAEIARFIAFFSLALYGSLFVFRTFIAVRLFQRYGAEVGFLALPMSITIASALSWGLGFSYGLESLVFFASITLARGLYELIGTGLQETSLMLVFQVMRSSERFQAQNLLQTLVIPMATGGTGLLLLAFTDTTDFNLHIILGAVLGLAISMWIIGRIVVTHYLKELPQRFTRKNFDHYASDNAILDVHNPATLQALRMTIVDGTTEHAKLALGIMMRMSPTLPTRADITLLQQHPAPEIQQLARLPLDALQKQLHPTRRAFNQPHLKRMLVSADVSVQRRALREVGRLRDERYVNTLLTALTTPALVTTAKRSLMQLGPTVTSAIQQALSEVRCPRHIQHHLIDILLADDTLSTRLYLLDLLPTADVEIQHKLMHAIHKTGSTAWKVDTAVLERQFAQDLALGKRLSQHFAIVRATKAANLLATALLSAIENVRLRLGYAIGELIPTPETQAAINTIHNGDADSVGLALEYLSMAVTTDERPAFRTLLSLNLCTTQAEEQFGNQASQATRGDLQTTLEDLLQAPNTQVDRWLRNTVLYTIGTHQVVTLTNAVIAAQSTNDPIIQDTAQHALHALGNWDLV